MLDAVNSKLKSSGKDVDFLIILKSLDIIDMTCWLGFFLLKKVQPEVWKELILQFCFFRISCFLVVSSILEFTTVISSLLSRLGWLVIFLSQFWWKFELSSNFLTCLKLDLNDRLPGERYIANTECPLDLVDVCVMHIQRFLFYARYFALNRWCAHACFPFLILIGRVRLSRLEPVSWILVLFRLSRGWNLKSKPRDFFTALSLATVISLSYRLMDFGGFAWVSWQVNCQSNFCPLFMLYDKIERKNSVFPSC